MTEAARAAALSSDARAMMAFETGKKSAGVAYVLWFFLGGFGAHRFYCGRPGTAAAQIGLNILGWLTIWFGLGVVFLGALGIWLIVDVFLVGGWVRSYNAELISRLDGSFHGSTPAPAVTGEIASVVPSSPTITEAEAAPAV